VWAIVLENASHAQDEDKERGELSAIDFEATDYILGIDAGVTEKVISAMREKGLIEGNRVKNWEKRQPKREREDNSAQRTREYRQRKNNKAEDVTPCDASVTQVTPCDAAKRRVTPCDTPEQNRS
jgi:hypothetical protein